LHPCKKKQNNAAAGSFPPMFQKSITKFCKKGSEFLDWLQIHVICSRWKSLP